MQANAALAVSEDFVSEDGVLEDGNFVELHSRFANSVLVQVIYCRTDKTAFVGVVDFATRESFIVIPEQDKVMDAFHHPYAFTPDATRSI